MGITFSGAPFVTTLTLYCRVVGSLTKMATVMCFDSGEKGIFAFKLVFLLRLSRS